MKHIYICTSKIDGQGVTAGEDIKKGETIQHIKGEAKFLAITSKEESLSYPNWIGIGKNKWIDPNAPNQYLNHSCNPNSGIKGTVTMVALKDIREGEEITVDYSIIEGDDLWEMPCSCGEANCRKVIRSIRYIPNEQFKKYLPYVPTYFKKLYLKHQQGTDLVQA
ncbi:MAG: nuclear protein [Parcubacteria group bacterium]|nr:nuclear protein [Parcubacteria group bacterium]